MEAVAAGETCASASVGLMAPPSETWSSIADGLSVLDWY